jgi:MFS family permease
MDRRKSSTAHYQTFPTNPPASRGRPLSRSPGCSSNEADESPSGHKCHHQRESPLPKKQLAILAIIALAEQTALNSISPYLPERAATFPEVNPDKVGLYVGIIASSFALAQFATNFLWGYLSDRIGRKPVILLGTVLTAGCFVAFAFVETLWQAIVVQVLMGLVNGNQAVVSTCLGEITDRSNQSQAFVYLPVIYGIGGITGPIVGGLLVFKQNPFNKSMKNPYPYLIPNIVSAVVLLVDLVLTMVFLDESLEEAKELPPLGKRTGDLFSWLWQSVSSSRPSYLRLPSDGSSNINHFRHSSHSTRDHAFEGGSEDGGASDTASQTSMPTLFPRHTGEVGRKQSLSHDTILLLATYLIFQLSNVSFNSLYPIFTSSPPPTGRSLSPREIGLSLSFAGVVTIIFQVGIFGKLRDKMGNRLSYRAGLAGFVLSFILMPWVGYKDSRPIFGLGDGKIWLWMEIGVVLLIKTVAGVGGLTSALLLVCIRSSWLDMPVKSTPHSRQFFCCRSP